jgi:hypothetical protein
MDTQQPTMLYVVAKTIGGYAREDADVATVVGAYTDKPTAENVAKVSKGQVFDVELNKIGSGYLSSFATYGIPLPSDVQKPA